MEKTTAGSTSLWTGSLVKDGTKRKRKKEAASSLSAHPAAIRPFQLEPVHRLASIGNLINCSVTRLYVGNPEANEWLREIPSACVDATIATGPIPLKTRSWNKMAAFLVLFSRFRQGKENRGFHQFENVFRKSISNYEKICFGELF